MNTTRAKLVQAASAYLFDHMEEHVTVATLAESCEVSSRTLQLAFHDVLGMSPKAWMTKLRLRQTRQILLRGGQAETVTSAAHDSGFAHLGRFSQLYRKEFGETPFRTLRQAQELVRLKRREVIPSARPTATVAIRDRHPVSARDKARAFSETMNALNMRCEDHSHWRRVHRLLHDQLGYKRGAVILNRASDGRPFIFSHCRQGMGDESFRLDMNRVNAVLESASGVVRSVLNSGNSRLVDDVRQAPEYTALDPEIKAELCVPVVHKGKVIGAVNFESENHDGLDEHDLLLAHNFAGTAVEQLNKIRRSGSLGLTDRI